MKKKGRGRPKKQFDILLMTHEQLDELERQVAEERAKKNAPAQEP